MIKSMTGYGAASGAVGDVELTIEVRSVNQRFLDLKLNAPREYLAAESELRKIVSDSVARGRVEVFVGRNSTGRSTAIALREDVAAAYVEAWTTLRDRFGLAGEIDLALFAGRSDLFAASETKRDVPAEIEAVKSLLPKALAQHSGARRAEGKHLAADMKTRVSRLKEIRKQVLARTKTIVPAFRERLEKRLSALLSQAEIDPARLAQETAILADRADVTEELVRLEAHVSAIRELFTSKEPVGKRMDFVIQEINRELNTIASKSADLEITNLIVDGKAEVEKLREQVQNVE
jgi:uncharacterized protein (TIGR00255 family)